MPKLASQPVTLNCPVCGAPIQADIHNLVDVGLEPELKGLLLRGRLNAARCGNCGREGIVAAPLMYHDPEKELLLVLIPPETQLNDQEQQQMIGQFTNVIMSYLPPEKRKGYLLVPKVLLSYPSLLEAILRAEGITPEMIAAQQSRLDLIERLRAALPDGESLRAAVAEADESLGEEFFATLAAYIHSSRADGRPERAQELEALRGQLLELSTYGRQLAARMVAGEAERPALGREELLEKMLAAGSEEELAELVAWYRGTVDYAFFQMLTERMEEAARAGQPASAGRLRDLRATLLALTERLDREAQQALEKATALLRELLDAQDAPALVRARLNEFDDAFFIVLGANLKAAEAAGRTDVREKLQHLGSLVLEVAQEKLPPEVRLIRRLMGAPDDAALVALLQENEPLVDENLALLIRDLAGDVEEEETELRLRRVAEQVEEYLRGRQG